MLGTLAEWTGRLASMTGLPKDQLDRMLRMHALGQGRTADPALTPLLWIGGEWIVASPTMLLTAGFERNFCALLARSPTFKKAFDGQSAYFSAQLTEDLTASLTLRGFQVATGVRIQTSIGESDIDLLVWDRRRRVLLAIELKAMIKTSDFKEVLNRGEDTCRRALTEQLPKYEAAMLEGSADLMKSAFGHSDVAPAKTDCILVVRGFVGTARNEAERFPVLNDRVLLRWLERGMTLSQIAGAARDKSYLPIEGVDFRVVPRTIVTPGGVTIGMHDWHRLERS